MTRFPLTSGCGPRSQEGRQGPQAHAASSALAQDQEEPHAKWIRQDRARGHDTEMSELVEYGLEDDKEAATTRVHIMRLDDDDTAGVDGQDQVDKACEERYGPGKVKIYVGRKVGGRSNPRSCGGQAVATLAGGGRHGGDVSAIRRGCIASSNQGWILGKPLRLYDVAVAAN